MRPAYLSIDSTTSGVEEMVEERTYTSVHMMQSTPTNSGLYTSSPPFQNLTSKGSQRMYPPQKPPSASEGGPHAFMAWSRASWQMSSAWMERRCMKSSWM